MSSANSEDKDDRLLTDSPEPGRKHARTYDEDSPEEDDEGRDTKSSKAKKLASGKRADQNRKAQRAFRQRKDKYIKDLELRSQELDIANSLIIQLKEENDRLNDIAKSFHNRVGELEAQLAQISAAQTNTQMSRSSVNYSPASPRNTEDIPFYSQKAGSSRSHANQQPYGPNSHRGSIYSQSQGLI